MYIYIIYICKRENNILQPTYLPIYLSTYLPNSVPTCRHAYFFRSQNTSREIHDDELTATRSSAGAGRAGQAGLVGKKCIAPSSAGLAPFGFGGGV